MQELGAYLRQMRESKNISLNDVQEATKIRLHYLEAIEAGNFSAIPGEVYLKGFLTNYATAIGLDGHEVLERYYQSKTVREEPIGTVPTMAATVVKEQRAKVSVSGVLKAEWFKGVYLGVAAALFGMLLISFFVLPSFRVNPSQEVTKEKSPTEQNMAEPSESENGDSKQVNNFPAPITVDAEFSERVWVQVTADGQKLFSEEGVTFSPSSSRQEWTAQHEMVIELGNAAGINLILNGKDLGKIGGRGETKVLHLKPNGSVAP